LELRAVALQAKLDGLDESVGRASFVPRLFLLEMECIRAVRQTELNWVKSVVEDLRSGQLTWSEEWLESIAVELVKAHTES